MAGLLGSMPPQRYAGFLGLAPFDPPYSQNIEDRRNESPVIDPMHLLLPMAQTPPEIMQQYQQMQQRSPWDNDIMNAMMREMAQRLSPQNPSDYLIQSRVQDDIGNALARYFTR